MPKLRARDLIIVTILGEIVGLFAYAVVRAQGILAGVAPGVLLAGLTLGVPIAAAAALYAAYILGKRFNPTFFQIGKFAAVGFSNTLIDLGIFNLLLLPLGFGTGVFSVSKAISFSVATVNSFFWNRSWSFEQKGAAHISSQAASFYFVTLIGLFINVGIAIAVKLIGPETQLWAGVIAPGAATVSSMVWNFVGYKFVVFRPAEESSQERRGAE